MALASFHKKILDKNFSDADSISSNASNGSLASILKNVKSQGATDQDLQPYYDQLSKAGFNIDLGSGQISKANPGTPGGVIPAPPAAPPDGQLVPTNPNLPSDVPGKTIPGPTIDLGSDRGQTEQEAAREANQATNALNDITSKRKSNIADLATILNTNASNQFKNSIPQIAEDANSAGVFRSTGYGNALALEQGKLAGNVATQVGLAGIDASNSEATGMQDIINNKLNLQQSGLQRQFSLADFQRQANLAKEIGSGAVPQVGNGKGTGALGGAATGALVGSKFGPWGGVAGAGIGAVAGGSAGGK